MFKQAQFILQKPSNMKDENCGELPIRFEKQQCISCWKVPFRERISILFNGKVWLGVHSPAHTQPPVWIEGARTVFQPMIRKRTIVERMKCRLLKLYISMKRTDNQ